MSLKNIFRKIAYKILKHQFMNILWLNDTIWWHRSWSTLVQVMTCCLTALSPYPNKCWHIILSSKVFVASTCERFHIKSVHCLQVNTKRPNWWLVNIGAVSSLRPTQNRRHFADDTLKCIFLNENVWIVLNISLEFVPKVRINNIPALVQIMAWRRPGDKPLSEPMIVRLPPHICVTRPQWVNSLMSSGKKTLSEPKLIKSYSAIWYH